MADTALLTRRSLTAAALLMPLGPALGQGKPAEAEKKDERKLDWAEMVKPGAIHENVMGKSDAPVTIVEYASLTCPHCATFHTTTLPKLKADYVDTGKVRFIFRDFPFDGLALAATMLSRCTDPAQFFEVTSELMKTQESWAFGKDPEKELRAFFKPYGFTQESFDACLQKKDIYDGVLAGRKKAYEDFGVDATPTLFINGAKHTGALTVAQVDAILQPLLAGTK